MDEIVDAINQAPPYFKRTCISMITNGRCLRDTLKMVRRLRKETVLPLSVLVSPTLLKKRDLVEMKETGVEKIGVAIDLATRDLFEKYRGRGVSGPHRWERYWGLLEEGLELFGSPHVGVHLMVGMGETEREAVSLIDRLWRMGIVSHLFSFFAEVGSVLADSPQPPWPTYLRVQLARYLLEEGLSAFDKMDFDGKGRIIDFGLQDWDLLEVIGLGIPFMTTGCLGDDGQVACNRPFGNCLPGTKQWNYPYRPNEEDLSLIRQNIFKNDHPLPG
jgi:biotin synthase